MGRSLATVKRHRHQELLKFLRRLDRASPKRKALHLILDNYGTHKHPNVQTWLNKRARFHLHLRGVFTSVCDLTDVITEFINVHNRYPKPFVWAAKVEDILQKIGKCKAILEAGH